MENKMQAFDFHGSTTRVLIKDGKPWFVGKDICDTLGYGNPNDALERHCKHKEKLILGNTEGQGGARILTIIPKGDVYRLIARSTRPAAQKFELWLFDEVVPTIEEHGVYMTPEKIEEALTDPDTIIKIAQALKEERARRLELEAQAEADAPRVAFSKSVECSKDCIPVGDMAKIMKQDGIDIGRTRLFRELREDDFLMKEGRSKNMPTQYSMNNKLFEIKETTKSEPDGEVRLFRTPMVTSVGQRVLLNFYKNKRAAENA